MAKKALKKAASKKPLRKVSKKKINPYTLLTLKKELENLKTEVSNFKYNASAKFLEFEPMKNRLVSCEKRVDEIKYKLKRAGIADFNFKEQPSNTSGTENNSPESKQTESDVLVYVNGINAKEVPLSFESTDMPPCVYFHKTATHIIKSIDTKTNQHLHIHGDLDVELYINAGFEFGRISHSRNRIEINMSSLKHYNLSRDEIFALLLSLVGLKAAVVRGINDDLVDSTNKANLDCLYGDTYALDLIKQSNIQDKKCLGKLLAKIYASKPTPNNFKRLKKFFQYQ